MFTKLDDILLYTLFLVLPVFASNNITFGISYINSDIILSIRNIDLSCGGILTTLQISHSLSFDGLWISSSNSPNPNDNSYYFDIQEPIQFPFVLSVRITRTLNSIPDTITATHTITTNSDTIDFGTNFCVEKNPYIWYLNPTLNVAYLYHAECVKGSREELESLCQNTYYADGVASIPTRKHYEFIKTVVANQAPLASPTKSCAWKVYISIGASLGDGYLNDSCTETQKKDNYVFWNGDPFNHSVFDWYHTIKGCGANDQRYLHLRWPDLLADDGGINYYALLCYKQMNVSYNIANVEPKYSTSFVTSTVISYTTSDITYTYVSKIAVMHIFIAVICVICLLVLLLLYCIIKLKQDISQKKDEISIELPKLRSNDAVLSLQMNHEGEPGNDNQYIIESPSTSKSNKNEKVLAVSPLSSDNSLMSAPVSESDHKNEKVFVVSPFSSYMSHDGPITNETGQIVDYEGLLEDRRYTVDLECVDINSDIL